MDVFVGTSRGMPLEEHFSSGARAAFWTKGGAHLSSLSDMALKLLRDNQHLYRDVQHLHPNIVYFIGGLPDITSKINDHRYQEIIYNEATHETYHRVTNIIRTISHTIIQANAIPCFATITPMSLEQWNNTRLNKGYTSYLLHHHQYEDMNHLLNSAIININNFILDLNNLNNVDTPKFASCIIKKRGQGRDHRIMFSRLHDGCHPTEAIIKKWKTELEDVMSSNRYRNATEAGLIAARGNTP